MNLKNHVRHTVLAVALASSIATAVGATGAAQADNEIPADSPETTMPSDQPAEEAPPGTDAGGTENPPAADDGTAAPTTTTPPTPTDPTTPTEPVEVPPTTDDAATTVPAQSGKPPVTTPSSAIATPTTTTPNEAIATVMAATAATAPQSLVATPANGSVQLKWLAPSSNGGAAINYYVVQVSTTGTSAWANIGSPAGTSFPASGLSNGTRYYFRVHAHNSVGFGPFSTVVNAVPRTVPTAPRSPVATPAKASVQLKWTAPLSNGGAVVDRYAVQVWTATGWTNLTTSATTGSYTALSLKVGTKYSFRIRAHNAAGWGPPSTVVSAIPITVPSAPLSPVASPGNQAVSLSWQAPANTGGAAVGYVVEYTTNPAGQWYFVAAPTTRYYTVSSGNLYNGTKYYFRIRARNAAGTSPASTVVSAIPRTKPSVVPFCKATQSSPGSYWVVVNWSPPSSNGGAPIQEYIIEFYVNGHYLESHYELATTTYNAYKMPYYFNDFEVKVYARNAAGYSPPCFVDHVSVLP